MNNKSGRVFGASLKPVWSESEINEFLNKTKGDITVFIINHDKDTNEAGEKVEAHTHIYLEYTNPRKISTVSNLLEVEPNFIEIVRNKKGYLRYLTHKDDVEKYAYDDNEVLTNSDVSYSTLVLGNSLTDKEIAQYLMEGKGIDLLGVVPSGKLRTIQSFLHFDSSNAQLKQIRLLNEKMDAMREVLDKVETIAVAFTNSVNLGANELVMAMKLIADEISKTRTITSTRKRI